MQTQSAACPEGWESDAYDFFVINTGGLGGRVFAVINFVLVEGGGESEVEGEGEVEGGLTILALTVTFPRVKALASTFLFFSM